ncbi:MAG TPA: PIN domain-containing protein, partial [Thermomicrobiales bacterium]
MNITVDANILVSELSGREEVVRSFLLGPSFERIYIAEYVWEEAQHELPKRFDRMVRGGRFSQRAADRMLDTALRAITSRITVVTPDIY